MDEVSRNTLERFIENVEELRKYCTPENKYGGLMGIFLRSDEEEWQIHPAIKGFLLTFSMFIKSRDGIAPYVLERDREGQPTRPKLLELSGTSESWKEVVREAYKLFDTLLSFAPPKLVYNGQPITRWEVPETFMYGKYAHVHPAKHETYKQWERDRELFGELLLTFQDAIGFMFFEILLPIAEASKHELGLHTTGQNSIN